MIVAGRGSKVHGKTQHYKYFHVEKSPSIKLFLDYLTDLDGGKRGVSGANQYAVDVSKFLYFASPSKKHINWFTIMQPDVIKDYIRLLTKDGIGKSGILHKIGCLRMAIEFLMLEADLDSSARTELEKTKARLQKWTSVLRKETVGDRMRKEQEHADNPVSMDSVTQLMDNSTADTFEEMTRKTSRVPLENRITMVASYLLAVIMFGNSQRPGSVIQMTVDEYRKRSQQTEDGKTYTIIKVRLSILSRSDQNLLAI